jgi:hypothetical protein
MSRYLEIKREFHPRWNDFAMADHTVRCYYDQTIDRNELFWRTTIPRFLQDRLRNPARAVVNGYPYPKTWSRRLRRIMRLRGWKHYPAYRLVHHT